MHCQSCDESNRDGAKFCSACAAPFAVQCANCQNTLSPKAKFCDQCGTPTATAAPSKTPAGAVRKTVTVIFCDLVGSTSFGEQVDAESARESMARYHAMAQREIEAHGGTVAKFIGDGVMALFGVPEVAEDDAQRAVLAGVALQRGFAKIAEHVTNRYNVELGLRVGINTGEVVIADDDVDLVGDALNTASRLEAVCTPGQVLVGEDTWRLTRSQVRYEVLGEVDVKGKKEAVATFQVVDASGVIDESTSPFVGRDGELTVLHEIFAESVGREEVRLATVIGAPGVGKTRLSRELRDAMGAQARVIDLRCERAGTATFAPIAEMLRSLTGMDERTSDEEAIGDINFVVSDLDDADRVARLLASFVGAAPTKSTEESFFAVRRLLEALGRQQPTVLIIDDIQWAEPLFLDLIEHLADWINNSPVFLLCLARPELRDIRPPLTQTGRLVATSLALEGLDAEATAELAAQLLHTDSIPAELLDRLPESTEGNPLFVRELMQMLVDDGVLAETDGVWDLTIDADAVEVPPTIQSLLSTRIERMPDDERRLIELAAVVGSEFPLGAVAAISGGGGTSELMPILERLRRKELIESTGTYWGDEPVFRFHHVLIRDAAYRRLLKRTRADLHLQVGNWVAETSDRLAGEHEVSIGYHFEQAHEYRTQLDLSDQETVDIGRRSAELLYIAAGRAIERDDLAAAGSLAIRAVARLKSDAPELADILMLGCEALLSRGNVVDGRPMLDQLHTATNGDGRLEAWAVCFDAQLVVLTEPGRLFQAEQDTEAAATLLGELGDGSGEAKARVTRASALAQMGRVGDCEDQLDLALTVARAVDDRRRVAVILGAAPVAALWGPSPVSRAGGRCLDVIRLLRITTGSPAVEATSSRCQAVLEALRGRFDTARSMLAESRETVLELGLRHDLLETDFYAGIVELLAEDPVAAEEPLRSAYQGLGRLGIGADAGQAAAYLARALLAQDRLDEADEMAADSDALAGQNPQTAIAARSAQAEIFAARGEFGAAISLAEQAVDVAAATDFLIYHAEASAALARVRAAAGDAEGAIEAHQAAVVLFEQKGATVDLPMPATPANTASLRPNDSSDMVAESADVTVSNENLADQSGMAEQSVVADDKSGDAVRLIWDGEPWNDAERRSRLLGGHMLAGDEAAYRACVHPNIEFVSHRYLDHSRWIGIDPFIKSAFAPLQPDYLEGFVGGELGSISVKVQTLAARGEHLLAYAVRVTVGSGADAPILEYLEVERWGSDGLLNFLTTFDAQDYTAMIDELERLYLEEGEFAESVYLATYSDHRHDQQTGDTSAALAGMDANFVSTDHRLIGWGTLDRQGTAERIETVGSLDGKFHHWIARVHLLEPTVLVMENINVFVMPNEVEQLDHMVTVIASDAISGAITSFDNYEVDDLPAAFGQATDLVARQRSDGARFNWATAGAATVAYALSNAKLNGILLSASDFEVTDQEGSVLLTDPVALSDPAIARRCGFGAEHRRVIGVHGARVALVELTDVDNNFHQFVVYEVDDRGSIAGVRIFDSESLDDATDFLDRRGLVQVGAERSASAVEQGSGGSPTDTFDDPLRKTVGNQTVRYNDEPWNEADRLTRLALGFALDADEDAWRATVHPQVVLRSHRSMDRSEFVGVDNFQTAVFDPFSGRSGMGETGAKVSTVMRAFASRGEHLVASHAQVLFGAGEGAPTIEMLHVIRRDVDGLLDHVAQFDPTDYGGAIAEIDRLYLEDVSAEEAMFVRGYQRFSQAYSAGDAAVIVANMDKDCVSVDHRRLGWGTNTRHETQTRIETVGELDGTFHQWLARTFRVEPLLTVVQTENHFLGANGAEHIDQLITVAQRHPQSGAILSLDNYHSEDLALALDRAQEIAAEQVATGLRYNRASNGAAVMSLMIAGGIDVHSGSFAADFSVVDHDGNVLRADPAALSDPATARNAGLGKGHRLVMSIRGDRLALVELKDKGDFHRFAIYELDDNLALSSVRLFDADSLAQAVVHYYERELIIGLPEQNHVRQFSLDLGNAIDHNDTRWLEQNISEDFRFVDHRQLGFPAMTSTVFIEMIDAIADLAGVTLGSGEYVVTDDGWVTTAVTWVLDDEGGLLETLPSVSLGLLYEGQLLSVELFHEDDFDIAVAQLHAVGSNDADNGVDAPTAEPNSTVHDPWNEADRFTRELLGLAVDPLSVAWVAMVDEQAIYDDRRPIVRVRVEGHDAIKHMFLSESGAQRECVRTEIETVAVRGNDLALVRWVSSWTGPTGTAEWDSLCIFRWTEEGKCGLFVIFEGDAYDEAVDELERLFLDRCNDPLTGSLLRLVAGVRDSLKCSEREDSGEAISAALVAFDSDFELVDHRTLGWGTLDLDGYHSRLTGNSDLGGNVSNWVTQIYHVALRSVVFATALRLTQPTGAEMFLRMIYVTEVDPGTGLTVRSETYAEDQLDDAMVRAAEIDRKYLALAGPHNAASSCGASVQSGLFLGRVFPTHFVADDVVVNDVDGGSLLAEHETFADRDVALRLGFGVEHRRVLSTRGELLALIELRGEVNGVSLHRFVVEEITPSGQLSAITVVDATTDGLGRLVDVFERRFQEQTPTFAHALADWGHLAALSDFDGMGAVMDDDFRFIDHRPLGFEPGGKSYYLDALASLEGELRTVNVAQDPIVFEENLWLARMVQIAVGPEGQLTEAFPALALGVESEGKVQSFEAFPEDDLDAAMARLEEIRRELLPMEGH